MASYQKPQKMSFVGRTRRMSILKGKMVASQSHYFVPKGFQKSSQLYPPSLKVSARTTLGLPTAVTLPGPCLKMMNIIIVFFNFTDFNLAKLVLA